MYEQLFCSACELESELAAGKATAKVATKVKVPTTESGKNTVVQEVGEDGTKKIKKKLNPSKGMGTNSSRSDITSCGNSAPSQNTQGSHQNRNPGANNGMSAGRGWQGRGRGHGQTQ